MKTHAFSAALALLLVPVLHAATFTVTNTSDSGPGSLRQAVADAAANAGADTVAFATGFTGSITLSSAIVLDSSVTIDASSLPSGVTIDGGPGTNRIFYVGSGQTVTLNNLTLTSGGGTGAASSGYGGAIYNNGGTLTVNQSTFSNNTASNGGGFFSNTGTLTVNQCTFTHNSADFGCAILNEDESSLTVSQSTFAHNSAFYDGGIYNDGTLMVNQSTCANNSASYGGGIINDGTMTLTNSIVATNTATVTGGDIYNTSGDTLTRVGANIVQNLTNTGTLTGPAFITAAPLLAPLGSYGGPTQTMPPLPGSPAMDAAIGSTDTTDQRGIFSPQDGNGSAIADIGAVEAIGSGNFIVQNTANSGTGSLRQAVVDAYFAPGRIITFAPGFTGPVVLAGEITVSGTVTIDASSIAGGVTISGNNASRLFYVTDGQSLTLTGLTLTGGNGGGADFPDHGGAIFSYGSVTVTRCTFSGNTASAYGGAIVSDGSLSVTDSTFTVNSGGFGGAIYVQSDSTFTRCTLAGNTASSGGGALTLLGGTTTLTHCTLAGNTGASGGGGIYLLAPATLTLANTLVAGNTDTSGVAAADIRKNGGTVTRSGHNLIGKNTTIATEFPAGAPNANGDFAGTAAAPVLAQLAPLASNVGPTQTMALLAGSPALDAATFIAGLTTDQRGLPRTRDGDATAGALPDLGAYEAQLAPVGSLGFNFNGASPRNLAAADLAGAPEFAQTHWNNLTGSSNYAQTARTLSGGGSATVRTWYDAPNTFTVETTAPADAHQKLMWGYLDSNGTANAGTNLYTAGNQPYFALADLPAAVTLGGYRVVVYADTRSTDGRVGEYWLTTHPGDPADVSSATDLSLHLFRADTANFSSTYTRVPATSTARATAAAGNFLVLENQTQPAFILRTEDEPSPRAPLNAVQILRNEIIVVTTAADENDPAGTLGTGISLREALREAAPGMGIVFDRELSGAAIALGSELLVTKSVTVDASSLPGGLALNGQTTTRILRVQSGVTCTLTALTLANGQAADTGAPLYRDGSGIHNSGSLTVNRCTITGNAAPLSNGGGIYNATGASLTVSQSTFANNSANTGSGIYDIGGTLTVNQSTFSNNSADFGGGIYNFDTLTLTNCIVATNTATGSGGDIYNDVSKTLTRVGANVVQNFQNNGTATGPAFINAAPLLAPLGSYGGFTATMPPLPGSPAIDAAVASTATTDQRGISCPLDGDGNGTVVADIGAVETIGPANFIVQNTADSGPGSLRQAVADALYAPGRTVTFAPGFTGPIVLAGELFVAGSVAIDASSLAGGVTISGNNAGRLFYVPAGQSLTLTGLTLTGGTGVGGGNSDLGGAILSYGSVTMTRCTLAGNSCAAGGGAITSIGAASTLSLTHCTVTGNTANFAGGIVATDGIMSFVHCTLSGNTSRLVGQTAGMVLGGGTATLSHCILAGNIAPPGTTDIELGGSGTVLTVSGVNLLGVPSTFYPTGLGAGLPNGSGQFVGTLAAPLNPKLAALASNGGPTQTMQPLPGSPVINVAVGSTATTDQRGGPIVGAAWDIGAVESSIINPTPAHLGGSNHQPTLTWTGPAGAPFAVFFGTNANALPSVATGLATSYTPPVPLIGTTPYYWRVDATLGGVTFTGPVFTFTPAVFVTNANNTGPGSLRQAMADATSARYPGADTILFDPAFFTGEPADTITLASEITMASNDLVIVDASPIAAGVTISGGNASRLFSVAASRNLALLALTLTGGNGTGAASTGNGGALFNAGTLILMRCTLTGNTATLSGGAIFNNSGTLTATALTFSGNTAPTNGGAVANGGGSATFTQCTFSANAHTGATQGGGALNHASSATSMTLTHCTISGNSSAGSDGGGGIRMRGPAFAMQNCIVAGNTLTAGTGADIYNTDPLTATGANIVQSRAGAGSVTGTLTNAAPLLAPLANYGGPTQTMALKASSPARNTAIGSAITADQRGFPIVGTPDIGAYEAGTINSFTTWNWETLPASATAPQRATSFDFDNDGRTNLLEYAALSDGGVPNGGSLVTFTRNAAGTLATLVFPTRFDASDLLYTIERSTTLGTWTPTFIYNGATDTVTTLFVGVSYLTNNGISITFTDTFITAQPQVFYRMRITQQ